MAARRVFLLGGTVAAAGAGYYLYSAGGDPKLAEKKLERDASVLSSKIQGEASNAKAEGKQFGAEVGSRVDSAVADAKAKGREFDAKAAEYKQDAQSKFSDLSKEAQAKFEAARKETGTKLNSAVDEFDKKVTEGAAKAKGGISSWFGGK